MAAKSGFNHLALHPLSIFITGSDERMPKYAELEEEWGEMIMVYFRVLSRHSSSPRVEFLVFQVQAISENRQYSSNSDQSECIQMVNDVKLQLFTPCV